MIEAELAARHQSRRGARLPRAGVWRFGRLLEPEQISSDDKRDSGPLLAVACP